MDRGGMPVPKPKPQVIIKRERRGALAHVRRAVRDTVWRRDGGRCRACQRRRGQHVHHLRYRSHGGRWTTANCLLLCHACHQDVHAALLVVIGANADQPDGVHFEARRWW